MDFFQKVLEALWGAQGHGAPWAHGVPRGMGPMGGPGEPRGMGPHEGPRGMGLKDPWASRTHGASRTRGPLGDPGGPRGAPWGTKKQHCFFKPCFSCITH